MGMLFYSYKDITVQFLALLVARDKAWDTWQAWSELRNTICGSSDFLICELELLHCVLDTASDSPPSCLLQRLKLLGWASFVILFYLEIISGE